MAFFVESDQSITTLQQGDLLESVPFLVFQASAAATPSEVGSIPIDRNLLQTDAPLAGFLLARYELSWGLVLNQTCDLQAPFKKPILIARARLASEHFIEFSQSGTVKKRCDKLRELREPAKTPNRFYLPAHGGGTTTTDRLIADLADVQRFLPQDYAGLLGRLKLRLSVDALLALQARFAYFSGRLAVDDFLFLDPEETEYERARLTVSGRLPGQP